MGMRQTIVIDDDLVLQARLRAAQDGITLSDLMNRALRAALVRPAPSAASQPFRMVTFSRGQQKVDHQPKAFARLVEEGDGDSSQGRWRRSGSPSSNMLVRTARLPVAAAHAGL